MAVTPQLTWKPGKQILQGILLCGLLFLSSSVSLAQPNRSTDPNSNTGAILPISESLSLSTSESFTEAVTSNNSEPDSQSKAIPRESYFDASPESKLESTLDNRLNTANDSRVGYDDGFVIAGPDICNLGGDDAPFRLKMNVWGQLRITNFDSSNDLRDLNQIQLKRARLIFSGHAFTSDFSHYISLDGARTSDNNINLLDYFLTYDLGHHTGKAEKKNSC